MNEKVRVRFAPSPTGPLHIGGVRTALYNYLFAKKHGGTFILRIEDTDQKRHVDGAEKYIIDTLNWCGIPYGEGIDKDGGYGPYRQSERSHLYREYAETLVKSGNAYYAFDTPEDLNKLRENHEERGETFIYNHHNRKDLDNSLSMSDSELEERLASGEDYVIRFKSTSDETISVTDIIRGEITVDTKVLDDKVLFKSDGMPTYHLANVVDDRLMKITHVIRGEEWIPSLPLHSQLYDAFGWEKPAFAHLPLILKPEGKGKLSKRDGDRLGFPVFPLEWRSPNGEVFRGYREDGYFPDAVINMLAFLGWNPGTEQEIFSMEELTAAFELEKVHKSGAKFDPDKTKWFQHHYLQMKDNGFIVKEYRKLLDRKQVTTSLDLNKIVSLVKERATFIEDLWEESNFFYEAPKAFDEDDAIKIWSGETSNVMRFLLLNLKDVQEFNSANISEKVKSWASSANIKYGRIMQPLRLALVGELKGPDLFEIMCLLGKEESLRRIEYAIKRLA